MERYSRNETMLSPEENLRLKHFRVAVVGCGGLGGYVIEMLARLGIGYITAIDGDVFEESNLNRQLLSLPSNIGTPKALAAGKRIKEVNPFTEANPQVVFLTEDNASSLLANHHVVVDALDNMNARRTVEKAAEKLGIPMVHAAIAGWYAQVCTIMPGDQIIEKLYPPDMNKGEETLLGNPSFTPALAASLQVAETLKVLLGKEDILRNRLLVVDSLKHEYNLIEP